MQAKVFLTGICVGMSFADSDTKPHAKIYYRIKTPEKTLHCLAIVWLKGNYKELIKVFRPRRYVSVTGTLISLSYKGRNNNTRAAIQVISAEYLNKRVSKEQFLKIRKGLRSMKRIYYEFFELKNQQVMKYYMHRAEVDLPDYITRWRKTLPSSTNKKDE